MKRALILGVGGMDGSHLAELLLEKGYDVHGLARRSSYDNLARLPAGVRECVTIHRGDLTDHHSLVRALHKSDPNEIYNLADQDEVGWSHDTPSYSVSVTYGGPAAVLELLRFNDNKIRLFQPISSTVFGSAAGPCDEDTPLAPASPYACAKAAAWLLCKHYRREHGVHVCCGVFSNHTSPRQKETYLFPTIARQAVEVALKMRGRIELTGPDNWVTVGHAADYVDAAWRTLQQPEPDDYVIGIGSMLRVSHLCGAALRQVESLFDKDLAGRFVLKDPSKLDLGCQPNPKQELFDKLKWEPRWYLTEMPLDQLVNHYAEELR